MEKKFRSYLTWRRIAVALGAAVLVVVAATAVGNIRNTPHQDVTRPAALPTVQTQQPQPTSLQQVTQYFGPFQIIPNDVSNTPDTQAPAALLVDDGSGTVSASRSSQILFSPQAWTKQNAIQIRSLTVADGYATFTTNTSSIFVYTVKVGQAFVLASYPQAFLLIDEHGSQWQITTARAEQLRRQL